MRVAPVAAAVVLLGVLALPASAVTWSISPDGSGDAPTIQAGIDSAAAGDTVSLRNGVFTGTGNRGIDFKGKAVLVCSESGAADSCVIDCEWLDRGFLFVSHEGGESILREVTVTRGLKAGHDGGAVYCEDSPRIEGCVFRDNFSETKGGAIYCLGAPVFSSCLFQNNEATGGGAVYCKGGYGFPVPEFVECVFSGNEAGGRGAAVHLYFSRSEFDRCRFTGNVSVDRGGAIASEEWSHPVVADCLFEENKAMHGGAFVSYTRGGADLLGCSFFRNTAEDAGGAIVLNDWSTAVIDSCLFVGNQGERGGAIAFFNGTTPTIGNCTISENRATVSGGCVYVAGGTAPVIESSILAFSGDGAAAFCAPNGSVTLLCSDVYGNAGGDWVDCLAGQEGENGNFSADPRFCSPETGYYYLHPASPCWNASGCGLIGALPLGCELTGVAGGENAPASYSLSANRPNPFNPSTTLRFDLPAGGPVALTIYDLAGRVVRTLAADEAHPAGRFEAVWDGRTDDGAESAAGIYFCRLEAGGRVLTRKMALIR